MWEIGSNTKTFTATLLQLAVVVACVLTLLAALPVAGRPAWVSGWGALWSQLRTLWIYIWRRKAFEARCFEVVAALDMK